MIELLISLLVFCLIAGLIWYLLGMLPIPDPFKQAVTVVFVIICIIVLLGYFAGPQLGWNWRGR
jgi:hypothetical protein